MVCLKTLSPLCHWECVDERSVSVSQRSLFFQSESMKRLRSAQLKWRHSLGSCAQALSCHCACRYCDCVFPLHTTGKLKNHSPVKKASVVQTSRRAKTRQNSNHSFFFFLQLMFLDKSLWTADGFHILRIYPRPPLPTEAVIRSSPLIYLLTTLKTFSW